MVYVQNRPTVYVAKGSHSNYFYPGEPNANFDNIWQGEGQENIMVPLFDTNLLGTFDRIIKGKLKKYQLVLLPDTADNEEIKKQVPWLIFQGNWGEWLPEPSQLAKMSLMSGPLTPPMQDAWIDPLKWANR